MSRTGFTLIELLVVLAIILMLIGVLMPALHAMKQQTQAVLCTSNIKQLSLALSVYEQANGVFPHGFDDSKLSAGIPSAGYPGDPTKDGMGSWWFNSLDDIVEDHHRRDSSIWCTSRKVKGPGPRVNVLCGNYGVNRAICRDARGIGSSEFVGRPLGSNQIPHPSLTLLVADSGYSLISWKGAATMSGNRYENIRREGAFYVPGISINEDRVISQGFEDDAVGGRHPNRSVNIGFADGHSERVKAEKLFVEMMSGTWKNRKPLWLP